MKRSTINTIIAGIFTFVTGIIGGIFVGGNIQNSQIQDTVQQSGLVNISNTDSSIEIVNKLLDEYININSSIASINERNENLNSENKNLMSENDSFKLKIDELEEKLDNAVEENEKLLLMSSTVSDIGGDSTENEDMEINNGEIEYTVLLKDIVSVDSKCYSIKERFMDLYGNTYPVAYMFDAGLEGFVELDLEQKYSWLTGYLTMPQRVSANAIMTIEIYGDDYKLLKKIENISKTSTTEPIFLGDIDVSNVKNLSINTFDRNNTMYGYLYMTDVKFSPID